MKKRLIILFTLITLFSVVLENYKSFFITPLDIEYAASEDSEGKDAGKSIEKEDLDAKEKLFIAESSSIPCVVTKLRFYIKQSNLLPAPYTSLLEMPPELA
jgi:hypothetical protein